MGLESIQLAGFVNDDRNSVGSVHFGVVLSARASVPEVEVLEPGQLLGRFMEVEDIWREDTFRRMETWSQLVAEGLARNPTAPVELTPARP